MRQEQSHRYYERHKKEILEKAATKRVPRAESNARRRRLLQQYVIGLKNMRPCADCKVQYPFYVMDYDHVRGIKVSSVSQMIANCVSIEMLQEEIAKCDLVCSNCHRERTHGAGSRPIAGVLSLSASLQSR